MRQWRPALRMARRDVRRHKLRALLTCVLVGLPVVVATIAALISYNTRWDPEREARGQMGLADAQVQITRFTAIKPKEAAWLGVSTARGSQRRDPSTVDLESLLPAGSTVAPMGFDRGGSADLQGGGRAWIRPVDFASGLLGPAVQVTAGRAPSAPDEVAVEKPTAEELGLLGTDGDPKPGATIALADGRSASVVGIVDVSSDFYGDGGLTLAVPTDSDLIGPALARHLATSFLVKLPEDDPSTARLRALVDDLAAQGVAMRPRDAILHPHAWGQGPDPTRDLEAVFVGALCIIVGLLEVVLLVGAAFAVGARRQVRDLGLLSSNGGVPADVRRVLLAQGVTLGIGSSLLATAAGVLLFRTGAPLWERWTGQELWRDEVDVVAVAVIAVLGSLTSVVAALLPGWSISRLTPVAALSGRFPIRPGESRAHRGAFVLAGGGLFLLAVGGFLTARAFAPRAPESPLGPFVAMLGLILLVAGTVWATPYVVRQVGRSGERLTLSGRYAFRDAARHRFRSAAAVIALTITVAGAVLAGFGFTTAARSMAQDFGNAPNTYTSYAGEPASGSPRTAELQRTVEKVVGGPVGVVATEQVLGPRRREVMVKGTFAASLQTTSPADLRELLGSGHDDVVRAFEDGSVVRFGGGTKDEVTLVTHGRRGAKAQTWDLPVVDAGTPWALGNDSGFRHFVVSPEVVADMGLRAAYGSLDFRAAQPFTQDVIDRLQVRGIEGYSSDPDRHRVLLLQWAGPLGAGLLSLLVVGVAVALAAAESRDDVATLAAVGAGPWRRRSLGAMHGLFLGVVGCLLGALVALPSGIAFTQLDGLAGVDLPWLATGATLAVVLTASLLAGWSVTPSRLRLTRRTT